MNKETLLRRFVEGAVTGKGSNLRIEGEVLYNYSTPIAIRTTPGTILLNVEKYSQTTSRNQNLLKKLADAYTAVYEQDLRNRI